MVSHIYPVKHYFHWSGTQKFYRSILFLFENLPACSSSQYHLHQMWKVITGPVSLKPRKHYWCKTPRNITQTSLQHDQYGRQIDPWWTRWKQNFFDVINPSGALLFIISAFGMKAEHQLTITFMDWWCSSPLGHQLACQHSSGGCSWTKIQELRNKLNFYRFSHSIVIRNLFIKWHDILWAT